MRLEWCFFLFVGLWILLESHDLILDLGLVLNQSLDGMGVLVGSFLDDFELLLDFLRHLQILLNVLLLFLSLLLQQHLELVQKLRLLLHLLANSLESADQTLDIISFLLRNLLINTPSVIKILLVECSFGI